MRFFLTYDVECITKEQRLAEEDLSKMHRIISDLIDAKFPTDSYGKDVEEFAIISTCFSKNMLSNIGWKERNLHSRKGKYADVRLFLDWDRFVISTQKERIEIYKEHIYETIIRFHEKHPKIDFDWERMLNDTKKIIENNEFDMNFEIPRNDFLLY